MELVRHLLADLDAATSAALPELAVAGLLPPYRTSEVESRVHACLLAQPLPGIVCRPTLADAKNRIQLGISMPFREGGSRVRAAILVDRCRIVRFSDPFMVAARADALAGAIGETVRGLIRLGAARGVSVGLLGSAALEAVTGLPYTTASSDIDLLVAGAEVEALAEFAAAAAKIAAAADIAVDIEVALTNGCGVKLAEVLSSSKTLLAKSLDDVRMLSRDEVLAVL